jgi:hypothetical protein
VTYSGKDSRSEERIYVRVGKRPKGDEDEASSDVPF